MTTVSPHGPGQLPGFMHLSLESPYTWTSIRRPSGGRLPDMTADEFGESRLFRRLSFNLSCAYFKTT
jgi:hypothetical protein